MTLNCSGSHFGITRWRRLHCEKPRKRADSAAADRQEHARGWRGRFLGLGRCQEQRCGIEHRAEHSEPLAVLIGRAEMREHRVGAVAMQDVSGPLLPVAE